jgi:Predicted kinase
VTTYFIDPNYIPGIAAYLAQIGWLEGERVIAAEKIGAGNMNLTIRVKTENGSYVLKQARPWVEKYPQIAAPIERAKVEASFYRACQHTPVAQRMPQLFGFDAGSNLMLMEDLGNGADLTGLYSGEPLTAGHCRELVDYLVALHKVGVREEDIGIFRNRAMRQLNHEHQYDFPLRRDNGFDLDRITPGLSKVAAELKADEQFLVGVRDLGLKYLSDGSALLHGDFFPGSWLSTNRGLVVIDPEFCFLGAREYDLGVFLAHLALIRTPSLWPLVEQQYTEPVDWKLARRFAGAEIMRRLLGVAQLPLATDLSEKKQWLSLSRELVCAE